MLTKLNNFFIELYKDEIKEHYNPDILKNELILVEHKNYTFVASVHDYEYDDSSFGKICYLGELWSMPAVIINKRNIKGYVGDYKEFVVKNANELLHIAKVTKLKSINHLINIHHNVKKKSGISELTDFHNKEIKEIYKNYMFKIKLLKNTWN